jgi:hypothetical protein
MMLSVMQSNFLCLSYLNHKEILQTWIKMGGGQTKTLSHFAEIRKQLIWGNKFILFKNKSSMFDNWINSDLIYINDILNENTYWFQKFYINIFIIKIFVGQL